MRSENPAALRNFVIAAFDRAEMDWREYVEIDPVYYRPAEVDLLAGDASKAKAQLGWEPQVKFSELVRILVDPDIKLRDEQLARGESANEYSN